MSKRYIIHESDGGIQCHIRSWKNWRIIILFPLNYIAMLAFLYMLIYGPNKQSVFLEFLIISFVVLIGGITTVFWLYKVLGEEVIYINNGKLSFRLQILPFMGWKQQYTIDKIEGFSLHKPFGPPDMWKVEFQRLSATEDMEKYASGGTIGFNYAGKAILFASKLYEDEARELYEHLIKYLPATAIESA